MFSSNVCIKSVANVYQLNEIFLFAVLQIYFIANVLSFFKQKNCKNAMIISMCIHCEKKIIPHYVMTWGKKVSKNLQGYYDKPTF